MPIFLAHKVTPRFYFETILPQLVTDNQGNDCAALIHYFQVGMTLGANGAISILNRATFPLVPWDTIVHNMRKRVLHYHLPQLSQAQAQSAQNAIATQLGDIASQQEHYCQQDKQRKVVDQNSQSGEKWLGPQRFSTLLKLSGVTAKVNLNLIWKRLADRKSLNR